MIVFEKISLITPLTTGSQFISHFFCAIIRCFVEIKRIWHFTGTSSQRDTDQSSIALTAATA